MNRIILFICVMILSAFRLQGQVVSGGYRVRVPYVEEHGKIIVNAFFNGTEGRFIVDTGAPCCVTDTFARRAGLTSIQGYVPVQDSNGKLDSLSVVDLPSLKFKGSVSFTRLQTVKWKKGNIVETFGVDGIIGYNFLRQGLVKFDGKKHLLTFTNYRDSLDVEKAIPMPLQKGSSLTLFSVSIGRDKLENVMFDSGASSFFELSLRDYQQLFATSSKEISLLAKGKGILSLGAAGLENESMKYRVRIPEFKIGNQLFKNVVTITTDAPDSRMGSALLKYGDILIDYPRNVFCFLPYKDTIPDLYTKEWDVVITVMNNHLCAGLVWDIAKLPLKGGEQIVKVNGKRYGTVNMYEAMTTNVVNMPGDKAIITYLDKNGKEREVTILRR